MQMWSLPGALGMFGLALGIQRVSETLPDPVYALLSGLNAATVGIIALAAVQLSRKAITDKLTRLLVLGGGGAGLCYNALWYFPVLVVIGGAATLGWDCWLKEKVGVLKMRLKKKKSEESAVEESAPAPVSVSAQAGQDEVPAADGLQRRSAAPPAASRGASATQQAESEQEGLAPARSLPHHAIPIRWGVLVIVGFFVGFATLMAVRGVLKNAPLELSLFNNMILAGTVIFGGGPVVIPLLREYVVEPGWVSARDFLLGLALIQAFPGPNFNFAVYLGGLALSRSSTTLGAVLGFVGIFLPGIALSVGFQSIWSAARKRRWVVSLLRGVNATAVGLVFTAVYRLWEIGYLTAEESRGQSLAKEPWWLAVSATTFTLVEWHAVPPAVAIVGGAVAGLAWWGAVAR